MRVFLDANVILDRFDIKRANFKYSLELYKYLIINNAKIYTSCDLITTIYYINSKIDKKEALFNIQKLLKTINLIEFSNKEEEAADLMLKNSNYKDLEDTLQYILAKKYFCDFIVSNDKGFFSKDIELLSSKEFCKKFKLKKGIK